MKRFVEYLAESQRTYDYRIKFCGRPSDQFMKDLRTHLQQFDPVRIGEVKSTPVSAIPTDFPNFRNEPVSMVDVSFNYPAIEPQIKQLAQLGGMDPNRVIMTVSSHSDSMVDEYRNIDTQNRDLLADPDYPADSKSQKQLSKDYSAPAHDHEVLKNSYRTDFTVAGGRTPPAKTTNDLAQGNKSPMTTIKRPPKPATGAQPRG